MAGTLVHSVNFKLSPWVDADGRDHYDVEPDDGGCDTVAWSSWAEIERVLQAWGLAAEDVPAYRDAYDLDMDDVRARNERLRQAASGRPPGTSGLYWLDKILGYLSKGEHVFYTRD
jgi:hypothetical protein